MKGLTITLASVALGLIATGLIVGFAVPISADGYTCGSAFRQSGEQTIGELSDAMAGGSGANACDQTRSAARAMPVAALIMGTALGGAAVVMRSREQPSTPAARESDPA